MKRLIIVLLLLPLALMANEYTLEELIQYGMDHSFSIQKSNLSAESAASSLTSSKWNLIPEADLTASVTQDFNPVSPQSGLGSSVGFALSKTISLNDAAYFNYKYATLDNQTAQMRTQQSYSSYAFQVFQAYVQALSAARRKSALEENLAIQTRVWEQSKVLLQLGKTTPFEVKQNEIAVMNSRISIIQLENAIATARSNLFALVQMQDAGYPLKELSLEINRELPEYATDQVIDLQILKQELKRSDLNLKQNKLDNFPKISLAYNLSRRISGDDFDFDSYNTNHGVSLNLSYSLWNHFRNSQTNKRSSINRQLTQISIEDMTDQIRRDYDTILQELEYLIRLDELYSEKLEQSQQQIKIAEERYRLGLIQLLELDKTRTDYVSADIDYYANRYQILLKQEALNNLLSHKIMGKW